MVSIQREQETKETNWSWRKREVSGLGLGEFMGRLGNLDGFGSRDPRHSSYPLSYR